MEPLSQGSWGSKLGQGREKQSQSGMVPGEHGEVGPAVPPREGRDCQWWGRHQAFPAKSPLSHSGGYWPGPARRDHHPSVQL